MTSPVPNHFETLGQKMRPWLEPETLKAEYLKRAAAVHPDRVHQQDLESRSLSETRSADLNVAYQILSNPRNRLQHLLQLLGTPGSTGKDSIPNSLMDLFFELNNCLREADAAIARKASASSPLLKARLFSEGMVLTGKLDRFVKMIGHESEDAVARLKIVDESWIEPDPTNGLVLEPVLIQLREVYQQLSYSAKWAAQVQERLLKFME